MKKLNKQKVVNVVAIVAIVAWLIFAAYTVMNFDSIVLQNEQTVAILNVLSGLIAAAPLKALFVVAIYCTMVGGVITWTVMELASLQKHN